MCEPELIEDRAGCKILSATRWILYEKQKRNLAAEIIADLKEMHATLKATIPVREGVCGADDPNDEIKWDASDDQFEE